MSAREVLHRFIDDLDEAEAQLFLDAANLSSVTGEPSGAVDHDEFTSAPEDAAAYHALEQGLSNEAKAAFRRLMGESQLGPKRYAILSIAFASQQSRDTLERIVAALWGVRADLGTVGRRQIVQDALGSIRAEGLDPSPAVQQRVYDYEAGHVSAAELYSEVLERVRALTSR